jgi:hypothetical protein
MVLGLAMLIGCDRQPGGSAGGPKAPANPSHQRDVGADTKLGQIAQAIADGVGTLQEADAKGDKGSVIVFEEYHTSRVGQLQGAVMLVRLHDLYGMRTVGLEGYVQSAHAMNATRFQAMGGPEAKEKREEVAVRMLAEGEISQAEFMALVFPDVAVRGLEKAAEYQVKPQGEGSPAAMYLLGIAEKSLTQSDIQKVNGLAQENKNKEALEYMMNADPWVREQFAAMKDPGQSVGQLAARLRAIRDKAKELGVEVEAGARQEMDSTLAFFEMAEKRSATMVGEVAELAGAAPGTVIAMVIGAGHSEQVTKLLRERGLSYALVRPVAFDPEYANLTTEQFERKNEGKWARTSPGTLGRLLNGQRKPPPTIERGTSDSYASALFAAQVLAEAVRDGKSIPEDVKGQLNDLPGARMDWDSVKVIEGVDVVFSMRLQSVAGTEMQVWMRGGTVTRSDDTKTLVEMLLQNIADLGGGGKMPPRNPPSRTGPTKGDEGPGDGKRGEVVISRTGRRSLVAFAATEDKVMEIGRISD